MLTRNYVQNTFTDTFGPYYPGQITEWGSLALSQNLRGFVVESGIMGCGVVKGTAHAQYDPVTTPYAVKAPTGASVAADIVGILVRTDASNTDNLGNAVPIRLPTMGPVAEVGSDIVIGAEVPAGATVAHDDPVFMSVSHATIPVGKFSNAAGTGLIAFPGARWYGPAAAGTVGRIRLYPVDEVAAG